MYSRNIPMAEKRIVCFQSKKYVGFNLFWFLTTIIIIYLKRYFEIFVTNAFLVYSGGQLLTYVIYSILTRWLIYTVYLYQNLSQKSFKKYTMNNLSWLLDFLSESMKLENFPKGNIIKPTESRFCVFPIHFF